MSSSAEMFLVTDTSTEENVMKLNIYLVTRSSIKRDYNYSDFSQNIEQPNTSTKNKTTTTLNNQRRKSSF